ncbi:MAG: sulfotransferase [Paraglaciecola sp.]|nr:sulfotransferase [Paraglaciecola sp.]
MAKKMILATGLQSGGTTLVSYAFLNHPQLDGILDMASDRIEVNFDKVKTPITWVKMTTIAFRWEEVAEVYKTLGYDVVPLLIVRNPFDAWASLKNKWYGLNGVTAEDPPLLLRFRRFFNDWQLFKDNAWPIIQYEDFLLDPEKVLRTACQQLNISFDPQMLEAGQDLNSIAYVSESNESFVKHLQQGPDKRLNESVKSLEKSEHDWIASALAALNDSYAYSNKHRVLADVAHALAPNAFDSRRYLGFGRRVLERKVSSKLLSLMPHLQMKQQTGWQVVLYGAGEFALYLYKQLQVAGIQVDNVVDSYAKQGQTLFDLPVNNPDSLHNQQKLCVLIASLSSADEIATSLQKYATTIDGLDILSF